MLIRQYKSLLAFIDSLPDENNPEPYNPVYDEDYLNEKIAKATKSWEGVDVDAMLADCRGYEEKPSEDLNKLIQKWDRIDINTVLKVKVKATGKVIDGFYDGRGHFDHFIDHDVFDRYSIDEVELMPDEEPSKGLDVTDFCKPIDPGIAQCIADHWWEMLGDKEPDKSLEKAAENIYKTPFGTRAEDFQAGAEWQEKQDLRWAGEIHKNGYNLCKEQMLKDAVEGEVENSCFGIVYLRKNLMNEGYSTGDKVKILILKDGE
jgi:hypothetical protein